MADKFLNLNGLSYLWNKIVALIPTKTSDITNDGDGTNNFVTFGDVASDTDYGVVKLNPNESVDLNANGQLQVGGRLGQYPNGGGLYYPTSLTPENVSANCFLLSEATNLNVNGVRQLCLFAGANVTLKSSAAAGSTTYYVNNTFANRFTCAAARGGYATIEEATAGTIIVKVTNVYYENDINKTPLVPNSNATESNNRIVIETETSANPDSATSKLRLYGSMRGDSALRIGQGVGTGGASAAKQVQVGQSQCMLGANSIAVGNSIFSSQNRVALFGANHINMVQGALMGGEGHDSTDGTFVGMGALGKYSNITSNSAFVIGNGTANTARSNLFEITDDGGIIVPSSTSGSTKKFKITVDDSGTLSATEVV